MARKNKNFRFKLINLPKFQIKHKIFAFFLILIILVILYLRFLVTPILYENTETQIASYAIKSINYAVAESMTQNVSYDDFINIVKDSNNDVSLIEANSVRINYLSRMMTRIVMSNFLEYATKPIKISLGSFSGISIFAGYGPDIEYVVHPYGEVFCDFISSFDSAGINQTYHRLYLDISITINIVFPFKTLNVDSSTRVLICETLIVGKIPEVYLNSNNLTDMLNLIPEKFTSWQKKIIVT